VAQREQSRLEGVDLDCKRVDKVLTSRLPELARPDDQNAGATEVPDNADKPED